MSYANMTFSSLNSVFVEQKFFNFDEFQIISLSFYESY